MKVMISDGSNFLTRDENYRYSLTTDKNKAYLLDEESAKKLIKNNLKHIRLYARKSWSIIPVEILPVIESETESAAELQNEAALPRIYQTTDVTELLQIVRDSLEAYCELIIRQPALEQQLYDETKTREDLEHTIENLRFNAFQGYDLCKRLQNISRSRRITKKNVLKLKMLQKSAPLSDVSSIRRLIEQIDAIEAADTYRYRKITEFGDSIQFDATLKDLG